MSLEAVNRVLSARVGGGNRKVVLLAYANHTHADGRHAWPSMSTVADYAELDVRSARRIVASLVADGWLRPGDQDLVSHIRRDRRPTVYDLAMTEEARLLWSALASSSKGARRASGTTANAAKTVPADPERPDTLSPRTGEAPVDNHAERPDTLSPRTETTTGQPSTSRPDTAVSANLERTSNFPPTPAKAGEPGTATNPTPTGLRCPTHKTTHPNCRTCGTSPRARARIAKKAQAQADAAARRAARAAAQAAAIQRRAAAAAPTVVSTAAAEARAAMANRQAG